MASPKIKELMLNDELKERVASALRDVDQEIKERQTADALSYEDLNTPIGQISRTKQLENDLNDAREKVRELSRLLDSQLGTPCAEIRHQQEVGRLNDNLAVLQQENEQLLARVNRLEIHDVKRVRKALYNLGFSLCESDEQLMQEWPSYLKWMIRKLAESENEKPHT